MDVNSSNSASPAAVESTGDDNGGGDDNTVQETGEDDLVSAMNKIEITERRNREKALKRPMLSDPESDSDKDGNQEPEMYKFEIHKELAEAIPEEYKRMMNFMGVESGPWLVAEMRLKKGDLEERLVIPARKLRCKFLSAVAEENLKREKQLPVEIIDPNNTVSLVTLTAEKGAAATAAYVITDWSGIVERNKLVEGDLIELWCFDVANGNFSRLCFMILIMVEEDQ